jgi:hypothetical protein
MALFMTCPMSRVLRRRLADPEGCESSKDLIRWMSGLRSLVPFRCRCRREAHRVGGVLGALIEQMASRNIRIADKRLIRDRVVRYQLLSLLRARSWSG